MCELCGDRFADESKPTTEAETDYRHLVQELVRLLGDEELFTFVMHPVASGTNAARPGHRPSHRPHQ